MKPRGIAAIQVVAKQVVTGTLLSLILLLYGGSHLHLVQEGLGNVDCVHALTQQVRCSG